MRRERSAGRAHSSAPVPFSRLFVWLMGLFAVLGVLGYFQTWLLGAAGARLLRDLRRRLFGHLVGLSIDFFDRRRVGELLSRMGSDLTVVQTALTEQIPSGLQAAARAAGDPRNSSPGGAESRRRVKPGRT